MEPAVELGQVVLVLVALRFQKLALLDLGSVLEFASLMETVPVWASVPPPDK